MNFRVGSYSIELAHLVPYSDRFILSGTRPPMASVRCGYDRTALCRIGPPNLTIRLIFVLRHREKPVAIIAGTSHANTVANKRIGFAVALALLLRVMLVQDLRKQGIKANASDGHRRGWLLRMARSPAAVAARPFSLHCRQSLASPYRPGTGRGKPGPDFFAQ